MQPPEGEAAARQAAARYLARRDLSRRRLSVRLRRSGFGEEVSERVAGAFAEEGYVDDARLARARSHELAERGYGDAAIAARLELEGIETATIQEALARLAPERDRARLLARRERDPRRLAALLGRRGFSADIVEEAAVAAAAALDGPGGTELR